MTRRAATTTSFAGRSPTSRARNSNDVLRAHFQNKRLASDKRVTETRELRTINSSSPDDVFQQQDCFQINEIFAFRSRNVLTITMKFERKREREHLVPETLLIFAPERNIESPSCLEIIYTKLRQAPCVGPVRLGDVTRVKTARVGITSLMRSHPAI